MKKIQEDIVKVAEKYVGIKEVKGNQGWFSEKYPKFAEAFEESMKSHGFNYGQAWCAYFGELVWAEVYDDLGLASDMDKYFSGSARRTLSKFKEADDWETGLVPMVGAIVVWKRMKGGKATWQGHVGIVKEVNDGHMITIEGNTNDAGSREGDTVARKIRKYNFVSSSGLALEGFIYPKGVKPSVPFKNKTEGDNFRQWVNEYHPLVAKRLDLDRKGSFFNSFIAKAWEELGSIYNK
jgi:surface antigen